MCAARVEILSENVKLVYQHQTIGKGRGVYDLRDFNAEMDFWHTKPVYPPGSISQVDLELGQGVGKASVLTERHNTIISIYATYASAGLGSLRETDTSFVIQDRDRNSRVPVTIPITDALGNTLVKITHHTSH